MSLAAKLLLALAVFVAGLATGIKYHAGLIAQRDLDKADVQKTDGIQHRKFSDQAAGSHAAALAKITTQLGVAREKIVTVSGRECLDAGTVRVLNAIGTEPSGTPAGDPAGAPQTAATDRDVGTAIATCRAGYGELASQLNQILDIEDRRYPPVQTSVQP